MAIIPRFDAHGGDLVDLMVGDERAALLKEMAMTLQDLILNERHLCDLELLATGAFSPLTGFMTRVDYESVLDRMRLQDGTLWPVPVCLDVPAHTAERLEGGQSVALRDPEGFLLAVMHVSDIWPVNREKEADTVRIVVLGESAAMGDPLVQYSAPRLLDIMLNDAAGPVRFEVINAAMTAINSWIIADIATELERLAPDIVLLYIGNNEVVGPYGPGSVFGTGTPAWITALRVRATRLRMGQLLNALQHVSFSNRQAEHFGMHLFDGNRLAFGAPPLENMYQAYKDRMLSIISSAQRWLGDSRRSARSRQRAERLQNR